MVVGSENTQPVREALFPSPQLRAIPSFSFDIPEGWELEEGTTSLAAVHPAEPVDGFWINVLVDHSRLEAAADFEKAALATFRPHRVRAPADMFQLIGTMPSASLDEYGGRASRDVR